MYDIHIPQFAPILLFLLNEEERTEKKHSQRTYIHAFIHRFIAVNMFALIPLLSISQLSVSAACILNSCDE